MNFLYCFSILFLELLPKLFFSLTNYVPKNSSSFKSVDFVLCCLRNNILKEKLVQFPELNRAQGLTVLILRTHAFFFILLLLVCIVLCIPQWSKIRKNCNFLRSCTISLIRASLKSLWQKFWTEVIQKAKEVKIYFLEICWLVDYFSTYLVSTIFLFLERCVFCKRGLLIGLLVCLYVTS